MDCKRRSNRLIFSVGLIIIFPFSGCQHAPAPQKAVAATAPAAQTRAAPRVAAPEPAGSPAKPEDEWIYRPAMVEEVHAALTAGDSRKASVVIRGLLNDGATQLHEITPQPTQDGFKISVTTKRPRQALATVALIPFDRTVKLDLKGRPSGPCKIEVNGITTTVMIP